MQKHLSALKPRDEPIATSTTCKATGSVEQLHSQALAALIGIIEDQWRVFEFDEESKSDIPRVTECSLLTDDDEEDELLLIDIDRDDDVTIDSLLDVSSTAARKMTPQLQLHSESSYVSEVAAIKSISILTGRFPSVLGSEERL